MLTYGQSVLSINFIPNMILIMRKPIHECLHLDNAIQNGATKLYTVDTDVVVILVSIFFHWCASYPPFELTISFGMGKKFKHYSINKICTALGKDKCEALPIFHAFSGSDSTSQFFNIGKTTMWKAWKSFPGITDAFSNSFNKPFEELTIESSMFQMIERFTCVAYKNMTITNVNEIRDEMFSTKSTTY